MKVSLNVVRQYIDFDLPPVDDLVVRINAQLGGVEEVSYLSEKYKGIVIAEVVSCVDHPDSDHMRVCAIDDGGVVSDVERDTKGHVQVVCGAPNVRSGITVAWLPPGTTVPASFGTANPFVLGSRNLRGVKSNGMLASPAELAIGDNHEGILEINPLEKRPVDGEITPGVDFAHAFGLDDTIIDIENKMFTHRPDLFGQLGVAREISAILKGVPKEDEDLVDMRFVNPDWYWLKPKFESASGLSLEVFDDIPDKVPRFMAVAMQDIRVTESPLWLQCALVALGGKPINNIVDATNYVMLLTAQPTHAYDYDKLHGHKLGARMATVGEKLALLNGKTYTLDSEDIVIVDGEGPVGLGGVMGGSGSEVSAETKNVVLEVASFDMYTVRRSSMRHGLFTDALTRFSKGQSPLQNDRVLRLLMQTIKSQSPEVRQASDVMDVPVESRWVEEASLSGEIELGTSFVNARLGLELDTWHIGGLLRRANFASYPTEHDENTLLVTAPFWRTDIDLPEDLVEEVGRLYGFDKLRRELPLRSTKPAPRNQNFDMKRRVNQILASTGANEVKTYSFVHEKLLMNAGQDCTQAFRLSNALRPDLQYYRLSMTPSLIAHIHSNIKAGHDEFAIYEFGKAHRVDDFGDDNLPREYERLSLVYAAKTSSHPAFFVAKRYLEAVSGNHLTYVPMAEYDMAQHAIFEQLSKPYDPKRAAVLVCGNQPVGVVGEFTVAARRAFKLPEASAGFEVFQSYLRSVTPRPYKPLSRFPYVTQDLSLVVAASTRFDKVLQAANTAIEGVCKSGLLLELSTLGIYRAKGSGEKTITLRLKAVSYDRTLTDVEVSDYLALIKQSCIGILPKT